MTKTPTTPGFLLLLTATAAVLLGLIIAPFAAALFAAAVLAGVLHPAQVWLESRLSLRPGLAAGALTMIVTTIVVAPITALCVFLVERATSIYAEVSWILDREGVDGLMDRVPGPIQGVARKLTGLVSDDEPAASPPSVFEPGTGAASESGDEAAAESVEISGEDLEAAATVATGLLDALVGLLVDLGVLALALFCLLSQGSRLVRGIVETLPLTEDQGSKLVAELRDVTRAVFTATVVTAVIQTLVAAVGFVIAEIDYLPIALLATFVAAVIPVVGAAVVVCGVGAWLLLDGQTGIGVFLLAWGVCPVGICDNITKPWLARGKMRMPGSVVLLAMLGGVAVFGPMGIVAGPLIVAFFLATLRLLRQEGLVPS